MPKDKSWLMFFVGDIHDNYVLGIYVNHFETYDQLFSGNTYLFFFIKILILQYFQIDVSAKKFTFPFDKKVFVTGYRIKLIEFKDEESKFIFISIGDYDIRFVL